MAVSIENYVFPRPSMELVVKLQESGVAGSGKTDEVKTSEMTSVQ